MISICIFSKNRAMQLDACLKSLTYAPYITDIHVLYTYDSDSFKEAYDVLISQHNNVKWHKEQDIHNQIVDLTKTFEPLFLWATDDSVFIRQESLDGDDIEWLFETKGALALNLRMGLNIKWQNHWKSEISREIIVEDSRNNLIIWDANKYDVNTDVGRVWQNDASIMPRDKYIERLLIEDHWRKGIGVRGLDNLASCGRMFNPCLMASFKHSVYMNVPINLVHPLDNGLLFADNWGFYHRQSTDELNDLFLEGKRIDWQNIDSSNLDCGRREVQYPLI